MKLRSKLSGLIIIISSIIVLLTLAFLSYNIYLYKGIETFYRIMIIIFCLYISLALISSLYFSNKKMQKKRYIITLIILILFTLLFLAASFIINNIYNKLGSMNKTSITYTTKLISFDNYNIEDISDKKIGIVSTTEDIEYHILPNEVIEAYKLDENNEIIKYDAPLELVHALYEEEVDLIFVANSYLDIFITFEEYSDIGEKAKEIFSYDKEYKKETLSSSETSIEKKLTEPFSILLLGIDSTDETLEKNASFNGDTMILATFNPNTMLATMVSFPRDTFVPVSCAGGRLQRINTSAWCGTNGSIKTVENLTGIDIDYYVKINFKGLVNLVNALGGIDVEVPYSFCEQNSSRRWGNSTVYVKKGSQHLNGEQALALARNRHYPSDGSSVGKQMAKYCPNDDGGTRNDFTRNQNQQLVIKGIIEAAKNIDSISQVNEILDTIGKSIDTNMSVEQMLSGYDLIKSVALNKNANVLNIQKTKLKTYSIGKSGHMIYEPSTKRYASVAFYYKQSLKEIVNAMEINLGKKSGTMIKQFSFDLQNPYTQTVIGNGSYSESKYTLVPDFSTYSISQITKFANDNSLTLKFINSENSEEVDISSYTDYSFNYQNEHQHTPVFRINSITIYVKPNTSAQTPTEQEPIDPSTQNPEESSTEENNE